MSNPTISRDLLGKIVDEVFDGAIEDASLIEEIYAAIKRHESPSPVPQLMVTEQQTEAMKRLYLKLAEEGGGNWAIDVISDIERIVGLPQAAPISQMRGIYIASKTKHADRWRFLRDQVGEPIISTWIDEAGAGESSDLADLWRRCIAEASTAQALILYREPEDVLKGGWIELGAALASGVPVFAVGIEEFTVSHDTRIQHFPNMKAAIAAARKLRDAMEDQS